MDVVVTAYCRFKRATSPVYADLLVIKEAAASGSRRTRKVSIISHTLGGFDGLLLSVSPTLGTSLAS